VPLLRPGISVPLPVSYEQVLTVLSVLSNRPVVPLTRPTVTVVPGKLVPSYGLSFAMERR